jgi:hypothetical protein
MALVAVLDQGRSNLFFEVLKFIAGAQCSPRGKEQENGARSGKTRHIRWDPQGNWEAPA